MTEADGRIDRLVYLEFALQVVVGDGVVLAGAPIEAVAHLEDRAEQGADERVADLHAQLHGLGALRQPSKVPTCWDRGARVRRAPQLVRKRRRGCKSLNREPASLMFRG